MSNPASLDNALLRILLRVESAQAVLWINKHVNELIRMVYATRYGECWCKLGAPSLGYPITNNVIHDDKCIQMRGVLAILEGTSGYLP